MDATTPRPEVAVERPSDRELRVTRLVRGPVQLVYRAWTTNELFERWWVPRSFPVSLRSCELDVRVGGGYRLVFGNEGQTMTFFGRYLEVIPEVRLSWTNDEDVDGPVTTVLFEAMGDQTRLVVQDRYPSKEALDAAIASGSTGISAMPESLDQLDDLVGSLDAAA